MRLIARLHDLSLAGEIESTLNDAGIPTFIRVTGFYRAFGISTYLVFVCLDSQFEDAQAVLRDPDHVVSQPVDVDAFNADAQGVDVRQVKWGVVVLAIVALTLIAYFWVIDIPVCCVEPQ